MNAAIAFDYLIAMLLVFTRTSVFLTVAPPFAGRNFNVRSRTTLAFAIAIAVCPLVQPKVTQQYWSELWPFLGAMGFQVLAGVTLGFVVQLLFAAFQAAGNYVDMTGGFAMASMFDPVSGTNSSVVGRITNLIATALLFTSGGHLLMLRGLLNSFDVQMTRVPDFGSLGRAIIHDFGVMIGSALQIAAPVLAVLFLADLSLGLVSRAVPSMNVFQLSFPVKLMLTLALCSVFILVLPGVVAEMVDMAARQFPAFVDMLGGGA